jgi:hypothetical protein
MTAIEIKTEIEKVLNEMPDSALVDALIYLKQLSNNSEKDVRANKHIQKILKEDAELLRKLAQ